MKHALISGMVLGLAAVAVSCGGKGSSGNLKAQAFYGAPTTAPAADRGAVAPKPAEEARTEQAPVAAAAAASEPPPSDVLGPSTRPFQAQPGTTNGTCMIVGVVVAEANGNAIYADKVLSKLDAALYAKAKEYNAADFRAYASALIRKKVDDEIFDELEFAAAQRNNTDEEQQIARGITYIYRQRLINKAGGSEAIAQPEVASGREHGFRRVAQPAVSPPHGPYLL